MAAASAICIMDFGTGNAEICRFIAVNSLSPMGAQENLPEQMRPVQPWQSLCRNVYRIAPLDHKTRTFMFLTECPPCSRM